MGWRLEVERPKLRAQELQPLYLQLPLVCRHFPQPPLLRRLDGLEHGECGCPSPSPRPVGWSHLHSKVIPSLCHGSLLRGLTRWLALHYRAHVFRLALDRVVLAGKLLCQIPARLLSIRKTQLLIINLMLLAQLCLMLLPNYSAIRGGSMWCRCISFSYTWTLRGRVCCRIFFSAVKVQVSHGSQNREGFEFNHYDLQIWLISKLVKYVTEFHWKGDETRTVWRW